DSIQVAFCFNVLLPDGTVLAACGATLVHADVEAEKILRASSWPGGTINAIVSHEGKLYVNSAEGLFTFDPEGWKALKIAPGGSHLAFDTQRAYYGRGPELFVIPLKSSIQKTRN
ncbi:MAG: hypothetical protein ABIH23_05010, partial [bacterium]